MLLLSFPIFFPFLLLVVVFPSPSDCKHTNLADSPCGKTKSASLFSDGVPFKVLGDPSSVDVTDFPHAVTLKKNGEHQCGGSLIHKQYVLTAGHCFKGDLDNKPWTVVLGDQQTRRMDAISIHEKYEFPKGRFDLALVKLDKPVTWSEQVQPVCLPKSKSSSDGQPEARSYSSPPLGFMAGYGYSQEKGAPAKNLTLVKLPILENDVCEKWYLNKNQHKTMHPEHLCAGYENGEQDGCQGDSGSGLVTMGKAEQQDSQLVLVGVMSWGVGCGMLPGVYTRVEMFMEWVQDLVKEKRKRRRRRRTIEFSKQWWER